MTSWPSLQTDLRNAGGDLGRRGGPRRRRASSPAASPTTSRRSTPRWSRSSPRAGTRTASPLGAPARHAAPPAALAPTATKPVRGGCRARAIGNIPRMARSIWTGAISFGLVTVPVKLYSAVSRKTRPLPPAPRRAPASASPRSGSTPRTGEEVPYERDRQGLRDRARTRYVVIDARGARGARPEEDADDRHRGLRRPRPRSTRSSTTTRTTSRPAPAAPSPTACCSRRCARRGKVAIAKVVIRQKESLSPSAPWTATCSGWRRCIFADEIVDPARIDDLEAERRQDVNDRELAIAKQLVESLAGEFDPDKYHDTYREEVLSLIERKAAGEEIVIQPESEEVTAPVPDLMSALKASLDAVRKDEPEASPSAARRRRARATADGPARRGARQARDARQGRHEEVAAPGEGGSPAGCPPSRSVPRRSGSGGRTSPSPGSAACATGAGSATSTRTGRPSRTPRSSRASTSSSSRRRGRTCGSARIPAATSRPPASTRRAASSTSTTRAGASGATPRSSTTWSGSPGRCPRLREHVDAAHRARRPRPTSTCWPCAVRLLDRGFFRIGSEDYAVRNETYGLATMKKRHVRPRRRHAALRLPGQARQAPRAGRRRPRGRGDHRPAQAPPRGRRRAAGLQARPPGALDRRQVRRHQPLPEGRHRAWTSRPRTSGRGARPCSPPSPCRSATRRGRPRRRPRSGSSAAPSRRSPSTSATPRRSHGPRTSTRGSSTASATGRPSPRASWAPTSGTAIQGAVEEAVLALLEG